MTCKQLPPGADAHRKRRPIVRPPLQVANADVALVDINDIAALSRMSQSWIHDEVRAGRAPKPLRFGSRCTRWKLSEVRDWLITRAAHPQGQSESLVTARAKKASAKAAENRAARSRVAALPLEGGAE